MTEKPIQDFSAEGFMSIPDQEPIKLQSAAAIPPEIPLSPSSNSNLRDRFDESCIELQRVQEELEEERRPYRLVRGLARELIKRPWQRLTRAHWRDLHKNDALLHNGQFRPCKIIYRTPVPQNTARPCIVHVIGNFTVGGSPRLIADLVEWTSDDYEHVVLTRYFPTPGAFEGINCIEMADEGTKADFLQQFGRRKPALVHIHHYAGYRELYHEWQWYRSAFLAAAECGFKVIENVNVPMAPYLHPCVHTYVYVSQFVRENYGFGKCRERVIYPGSDFSVFKPQRHAFTDTLGMVYRLDESKLRKESIEVFIRVLQQRPTAKALIIGNGGLLPIFKERAEKAGLAERFTFTGYVSYEKLPEYYNRMDVFVAPVYRESFGQVTPFAMNMGIPVAAYRVGALPEVLDDPSVTVTVGDADGLARLIIGLLSDRDRYMKVADRNQQRATSMFSAEAMAEGYRRLYQEILNGSIASGS